MNNPFRITTPEDLSAEETVQLFVDIFTDFRKIIDPGHIIMMGPRGVGKSMMFRYLEPDCQCLSKKCKITDLPFLGVYLPLKNTNFALTELQRFENNHASTIINEHFMIVHFLMKLYGDLNNSSLFSDNNDRIVEYYNNFFIPLTGLNNEIGSTNKPNEIFQLMADQIQSVYRMTLQYIKKVAFVQNILPYEGPLYDYIDYMVPLISNLGEALFSNGGTVYLLLDDAHFLTETQTKIINTWISTRTSRKVSIKVSSQYSYKTFYTTNGATIDTPHDFTEIDISSIYTRPNKSSYLDRVKDVVEKRLKNIGVNVNVYEFFPFDEEQEKKIDLIKKDYIQRYDRGEGRGQNRTDDALRYARPDYIKNLGGSSKSSHTYSYSGFEQLVNVSSGVIRYFLNAAHIMYANTSAINGDEMIRYIPTSIQNRVVRDLANDFLFNGLEKLVKEGHQEAYHKEDIEKLSNLIQGLGGMFRETLISERSERRIFSIAISDTPSEEVKRILELGIQLGYFHKSTIGRKDGGSVGRTRLYIMNRQMAPIWNLDPNGFSGYLFIKNKIVEDALQKPFSMLRRIGKDIITEDNEFIQLSIFDDISEVRIMEAEEDG